MAKRKRPEKPARPSFSDAAKAALGIETWETRLKREKAELELTLKGRIAQLENTIRACLLAVQEGRSGDGVKALRAAVPAPPPVTGGAPDEPRRA